MSEKAMRNCLDSAEVNGLDTGDLDAMHKLQGGDYVGICDPEERYSDGDYLILCVPAGGPLDDEGFSLPESLVDELRPMLEASGYHVA